MTSVNTSNWTALQDLVNNPDGDPLSIQNIAECKDSLPTDTQPLWMLNYDGKDKFYIGPEPRNLTINELSNSANNILQKGYSHVCYSKTPEADGTYPLTVYKPPVMNPTVAKSAAETGGVATCTDGNKSAFDIGPLTAQQSAYLESKLSQYGGTASIVCKKTTADGGAIYWLNSKLSRWNELIDGISSDIEKGNTPAYLLKDPATDLLQELKDTRAGIPAYISQQGSEKADKDRGAQSLLTKIMIGLFALAAYSGVRQLVTDIKGRLKGRVKTTNFSEVIRRRIATNPRYDVTGRDAEARAAWEMTNTLDYRHLIIDAPTGEGKDVTVEKMIIMKERGDPVVPARFRNAPVFKINAAEFQANTMFRGNVADKVTEIAARARKGPVIYYISEIDLIFLSGVSSSGDSEAVGKLLLDLVEDPVIRNNLILIGTTSRGQQMLTRYPDLQRRFNWPNIHSFSLSEIVNIIDSGWTKTQYEQSYGVRIPREAVEAAARLAEAYYRPSMETPMPRFDAIKKILEDAVKMASSARTGVVSIENVIAATEVRCGQTLDRAAVDRTLATDINVFNPQFTPIQESAWNPTGQAATETNIFTDLLKNDPQLQYLTLGLSNAEVAEYGRWLNAEWTALSVGERAVIMSAPGSYKIWVVDMSKMLQSGSRAEGIEAERAEDKDKKKKEKTEKEKTAEDPAKGADHTMGPDGIHGK